MTIKVNLEYQIDLDKDIEDCDILPMMINFLNHEELWDVLSEGHYVHDRSVNITPVITEE